MIVTQTFRRIVGLGAVAVIVAACGTADDAPATDGAADDAATAAERLCPAMWEWQKNIGAAFNEASTETNRLTQPEERRQRWLGALDEMERLNSELDEEIAALELPVSAPLAEEVAEGLVLANNEIETLRTLIRDTPEIDDERPQTRAAQLAVRVEKVISAAKPRLGPYNDEVLIAAFIAVPSCQHAVYDANDRAPRFNG